MLLDQSKTLSEVKISVDLTLTNRTLWIDFLMRKIKPVVLGELDFKNIILSTLTAFLAFSDYHDSKVGQTIGRNLFENAFDSGLLLIRS